MEHHSQHQNHHQIADEKGKRNQPDKAERTEALAQRSPDHSDVVAVAAIAEWPKSKTKIKLGKYWHNSIRMRTDHAVEALICEYCPLFFPMP